MPPFLQPNLSDAVTRETKQIVLDLDGEAKPGNLLQPQLELAKHSGVWLSTVAEADQG